MAMIIEMDFTGGKAGCSYCKYAITAVDWDEAGRKILRKYKVCAHPLIEEYFVSKEIELPRPRWCPMYKGDCNE